MKHSRQHCAWTCISHNPYLYQKKNKNLTIFPSPKHPCSQKALLFNVLSWFFLKRISGHQREESHIVKIEKPNEKGYKKKVGQPQGSAGQGGIGLFQAVGYLTGEMEEYRSWLEGRQMSRDEAARPGQGAGAPPGLDWGSCSSLPTAGSPKLAQ